ncbi:MAG TPA: DNA topoisomerase VI subunit B [Deltaproteobacteria bacterium]|nr:DNA topoisomerase VI subunit B [Deltaproteobacteria bacterium]
MAKTPTITSASSAEYFAKNLQQVGFSSYTKAALTTIKEAVDNSLDACEDAGILPEITVFIEKVGEGTAKNADSIRIRVEDNGPGLEVEDVVKVFGEYLASSKFGRGRCSRGQQGIGISAVTTWAQLTSARGATIVTKTKKMRKAVQCVVEVDIKHNRGTLKSKDTLEWGKDQGLACEFVIDARIQLNGEGGLLAYLNGTTLVNPHLTLRYKILDQDEVTIPRVTDEIPQIPDATDPHPHTMKLGEFIAHSHLFGRVSVGAWLKKGFSRISDGVLKEMKTGGLASALLDKSVDKAGEEDFKKVFAALQKAKLMAHSTTSVLSIGETALAKSIQRVGQVDFFSVVSRKPAICDFKPVLVETAIARLLDRPSEEESVTLLRFANRVPLQFDKSACAMTQAAESVNWRAYGLNQPKGSLPLGPYIMAISVVSPFIKFKNASKETVDASDELVEEIRRTLIQAGQRLSKYIRRETKEADLEKKRQHIEMFAPILVDGACRITGSPQSRRVKALDGLAKILGRDAALAEQELEVATRHAEEAVTKMGEMTGILPAAEGDEMESPALFPAEKVKTGKAAVKARAAKAQTELFPELKTKKEEKHGHRR